MKNGFKSFNKLNEKGIVTGGNAYGTGFTISWQNGAKNECENNGGEFPNGAFVEDVIGACIDRISSFQKTSMACEENRVAIGHLELALHELEKRTKSRVVANVEGDHKPIDYTNIGRAIDEAADNTDKEFAIKM